MGIFGFGKKKKDSENPKQTNPEHIRDAIDKNNLAVDNLDKRQLFLEKKVNDMDVKAREAVATKNKRSAMEALKRKKMLLSELDTLSNAKMTIEQQVMTMQAGQTQITAFKAIESGLKAQKMVQGGINCEQVDQLMDDIQDQKDIQDELANCFRTSMMDEDDDLLDEFNALQEEQLETSILSTERQMLSMGPTPTQPTPARARRVSLPVQKNPAESSGLTHEEASELEALRARLEMPACA